MAGFRCCRTAELIPLEINLEPVLDRHTGSHIERIRGTALLLLTGDSGSILSADCPVITIEVKASADTLALEADTFAVDPVALPTEDTDFQALDRLELNGSDNIFLLVGI